MSSFLQILIDHHKKNRMRSQTFFFLKACMAAGAVVAIADGHACRKESIAAELLVKALDKLDLFDPRHGAEIYGEFVERIESDPEQGLAEAREAIAAVLGNEEMTALLVMVCHTISEADGVVRMEEEHAIEHICTLLQIDPGRIKAVELDYRSHLTG